MLTGCATLGSMKNLLFLGACLWALAGRAQAQTVPADVVVVRLDERGTTRTAYITSGEGKTEKVLIKTGLAGVDKTEQLMGEGYRAIFQKLYQQGYVVQSTFNAYNGSAGGGMTTLLFVKAK